MERNELKELLATISGKEMKRQLVEILLQGECVAEAMDIAANESGPEAFRAAWGLTGIYEEHRGLFLQCRDKFLTGFPGVKHHSARRQYGCIMLALLEHREYCPDPVEAERLAETVCTWSIDAGARVSEKVWVLSILKRLSGQVEWAEDLLQQIMAMNETDMSSGMKILMRRLHE